MRKKVLLAVVISLIFTLFLAGCTGESSQKPTDEVEIYAKSISIDASTIPSFAYVGEFNVSDLRLNVTYSDDSTKTVSLEKNMIMTDSLSKLNKEGTHVIKVFYENCQTSFNIKLVVKAKTNYTLRVYGGKPIAINDEPILEPIVVSGEYFEDVYAEGTVVTIEWIPVEGNSFSEWTDSNNPQFRDTQSITKATMNMNHVYRASSTPAVMTVNFETNCSVSVGSKKTDILYESDIPELKKEGYVFDGWTTEKLIGEDAIDSTAKKITFPYAITVNNSTLYGTWRRLGLEYISYTNPVTGNVGYKVSSYVKNDKELTIPERHDGLNVIAIDADALNGATALEKLFIPATVEEIGDGFVRNCSRLKEIDVGINSNRFSVSDGVLYNYNMDELIAYPAGKLTSVVIPDGIKVVRDYAFHDALVGGIELPASLREIGAHAFDSSHIDYVNLTAVNPTESGFKVGEKAFNENISVIVTSQAYLSAYNGIPALSEFESKFTTDADGISNIGTNEQGTLLYKEIRNENSSAEFISTTIEIIGADRSITELIIPVTLGNYDVSSIGVKAFNGCIYLSSVTIPSESKLERILEDAFTGTPYIEKLASKTIIANDILYKYLGEETVFVLPSSVSRIAERAFMNNARLTRLDLRQNNKLNYIGPYAFYGCVNFAGTVDDTEKGFYAKKDLVTVANYAFSHSGIVEFGIPESSNSLKAIGKEAFANCYYIKKVTIGSATEEIDSTAFLFCDALKEFNVAGENKSYAAVDGVLYSSEGSNGKYNALFMYPAGRMDTEYRVKSSVVGTDGTPTDVTYISDYAFFHSNVAAICIPSTIVSVSSRAVYVPGLIYAKFEKINDSITYDDLFVLSDGIYEKYQPEYIIAPSDDSNIDVFFGNNAVLKDNVLRTEFDGELVSSDDGNLILRITDNASAVYASVVRSDRSCEKIEISADFVKDGKTYFITEIEEYAFFGRYLTELTLGSRLSKLADYSLKHAENLDKLYVMLEGGIPLIFDNTFGDKFDNGMFIYVPKERASIIKTEWKLSSYKYIIDIATGLPEATFGYTAGEEPQEGTGPVGSVSGEITAEWAAENIPVRKGYSFEGWLDDEGNLIDLTKPYKIPYNIELKCKWKPATFRIIFNIEKKVDFAGEKEITINYGDSYNFTVPVYSDGSKTFLHWKTGDGVVVETSGVWKPTFSDTVVNLYAEWEIRKFTLIYDIAVGEVTSYQVSYDDNYTLGIPVKTGYVFKGWALDPDGTIMLTNPEGKSLLRWEYTDSDEVNIYSIWEATYVAVNLYFAENTLFKTVTVKFGESFSFPYEGISDESWAQKKNIFCGWYAKTAEGNKRYTDENGDGLFNWEDGQATDLYALWPIEIRSEEELHGLADFSSSVILQNDIVVTKPIGSGEKPFEGIFIGNGYKITFNYTVSADTVSDGFIGLFARNAGTIKDLVAEIKITVEATDNVNSEHLYIGALTGLNEGKIINSTVNGVDLTAEIDVNVTKTVTKAYVGGYAGKNAGGEIKNISVNLLSFSVKVNGEKFNPSTHAEKYICGTVVGSFDGGRIGTAADDPDKDNINESFNYYYTEDDDAFKDIPCGENLSGTTINIGVSASKKSI